MTAFGSGLNALAYFRDPSLPRFAVISIAAFHVPVLQIVKTHSGGSRLFSRRAAP
jgi:hypothetical protein